MIKREELTMKNFIKKIGAVFLSLTVTASLFAGC